MPSPHESIPVIPKPSRPTVDDYRSADTTGALSDSPSELFWNTTQPVDGQGFYPGGEPWHQPAGERSNLWRNFVKMAVGKFATGCNTILLSGRHGTGKTMQTQPVLDTAGIPYTDLIIEDSFRYPVNSLIGRAPTPQESIGAPEQKIVLFDEMSEAAEYPEVAVETIEALSAGYNRIIMLPGPRPSVREKLRDGLAKVAFAEFGSKAVFDAGDVPNAYVNPRIADTYLEAIGVTPGVRDLVSDNRALRAPRLFGAFFEGENALIKPYISYDKFTTDMLLKILRGSMRTGLEKHVPGVPRSKENEDMNAIVNNILSHVVTYNAHVGGPGGLETSKSLSWEDVMGLHSLVGEEPRNFTDEEIKRLGFDPREPDPVAEVKC